MCYVIHNHTWKLVLSSFLIATPINLNFPFIELGYLSKKKMGERSLMLNTFWTSVKLGPGATLLGYTTVKG